jgi:hypothetical protein
MNILLPGLILFVVILGLVSWIASRPRGRQLVSLANVAEGTWQDAMTLTSAAAFAIPHLLGKLGVAASSIDVCGAADKPFGFVQDGVASAEPVAVEFLGKGRSKLGVASAAIDKDALLSPAAAGKVRILPVAPGSLAYLNFVFARLTAR